MSDRNMYNQVNNDRNHHRQVRAVTTVRRGGALRVWEFATAMTVVGIAAMAAADSVKSAVCQGQAAAAGSAEDLAQKEVQTVAGTTAEGYVEYAVAQSAAEACHGDRAQSGEKIQRRQGDTGTWCPT